MGEHAMLSTAEVAARTGYAPRSIWRWIKMKKIAAYRIGGEYRFEAAELQRFLEARRTGRR